MTDSTEKTDSDNQKETEGKLFTKGGPGGPGRGNKKPLKKLTLSEIEEHLQHDLRSSDAKIRHNATKLLLAIRKQGGTKDTSPVLDSRIAKIIGKYVTNDLLGNEDITEVNDNNLLFFKI